MNPVNNLPQLKIILSSPNHEHYRHIMLGNDSLCFVEDLQAFYRAVGYTVEKAKAGILPEEFIWQEYVHNDGYSVCLQKHILDYLHAHSPKFNELYSEAYLSFCEAHKEARLARGDACAGCKLVEYCKDSQPDSPACP